MYQKSHATLCSLSSATTWNQQCYFQKGSQLETIPSWLYGFYHKLKALIVAYPVTMIEYRAFRYCNNLTLFVYYFSPQSNLHHIEEGDCADCPNLQNPMHQCSNEHHLSQ